MVFIPNDILDEFAGKDDNERIVLICYAMLSQREGVEPDISRLAETANLPLDVTQDALTRLSERGWLERVKNYSE